MELPLTYRGLKAAERRERVLEALERVGLSHRLKHYPSQLSGGQQQRAAVARGPGRAAGHPARRRAHRQPRLQNGGMVMELLQQLNAEGATICMVTHDPRYAGTAGRIIHLLDGRIVEETAAAR